VRPVPVSKLTSALDCPARGAQAGFGRAEFLAKRVISAVYAIVRSGSKQQKVAVGDVIEIDTQDLSVGDSVSLPVVLVVDGDAVTTDSAKLAKSEVQAEVLGATRGPKIHILKYKNKTGYRKRQGHRQRYTQVKVTAINTK
jgi:large subunit ribosomal protein L21